MLNIVDLGFLSLAFMVAFTGFLINHYEKHIPAFIIKGFKYGAFAYQGSGANYLQIIEVPKALYRHFYAFSSVFSIITLVYAVLVYYYEFTVHRYFIFMLKLILEQDEPTGKKLIPLKYFFYNWLFFSNNFLYVFSSKLVHNSNKLFFTVSATAVCIALFLLSLQCIRRCYETYCLQVFAKDSKMNLSHYIAGLLHYFAVIVAAVGQGPLFCGKILLQ